ncbi:MAG: AAA family ATPase [Anaerolineae bacterium]|nr:AAA family ATPase [Anaerolineae bacterium]
MRIEKIYLRHIGPFEEITIDLPKGNDPKRADTYIFTGLNGSGKSTILYALAAVFAAGISPDINSLSLILRRMWAEDSLVAVSVDGETTMLHKDRSDAKVKDPFQQVSEFERYGWEHLLQYNFKRDGIVAKNAAAITNFQKLYRANLGSTNAFIPIFAYAGYRTLESYNVNAIQDLPESPIENSLSFVKTGSTKQLAQWIANTYFKEASYHYQRDEVKRNQQIAAIGRINNAMSDITDILVSFEVSIDPIQVKVKQGERSIELDLLPDGLKSIASFLADLLMRLDRLPPHPDYPTALHRPFILLLDEIEIHLHAKWQRQILPVVQKLFPNAQILASTHSPFVVGSAFDAHIIQLKTEGGKTTGYEMFNAQIGQSYETVLGAIFELSERFDPDTERQYRAFEALCDQVLAGEKDIERDLRPVAQRLAEISLEISNLVTFKFNQTRQRLKMREKA